MTEPDKDSWTMTGNSGSNASTNFIGTTDNRDLVFKTNNSERYRIKSGGQLEFVKGTLKVDSVSTDTSRAVAVDENGVLRIFPPASGQLPCIGVTNRWYTDYCSTTTANDIYNKPSSGNVAIGLKVPFEKLHVQGNAVFSGSTSTGILSAALINGRSGFSTATTPDYTWYNDDKTGLFHPNVTNSHVMGFTIDGTESMRIVNDGTNVFLGIGIGSSSQSFTSSNYKLVVNGKIGVRDEIYVRSGTAAWPDYVFSNEYPLKSLEEVNDFLKENHHLPGMPTACEIEEEGQPVGKIQQLQQQKIEELYLYIIKLQKQVDDLQKQVNK